MTAEEAKKITGCRDCPMAKGCEQLSLRLAGCEDEADEEIVSTTKPRSCKAVVDEG